jgi:MFS transporter, DHA1 family, tetracycline resistance protein
LPLQSRRPFEWRRANPLGTLIQIRSHPVVLWLIGAVFLWQLGHQVLPSIWAFYTISKFQWTSAQVGYSLAFVGLVMAFAQGVLTRSLIPRLGGERPAAAVGMAFAILAYVGYAFATQGWMMYVVSASSMFFAMTYPSLNALMSQQIPHDAQGELQGAVASVYSLSAILGPPLMTQVFGLFSRTAARIYFPGAPFLAAALLTIASAALFARAMRLSPRQTSPAPIV